jgi:hypothetical protein
MRNVRLSVPFDFALEVTVIATRSLLDVFQLFYYSFRWTGTPYLRVLSPCGSFTSAEAPSVIFEVEYRLCAVQRSQQAR